MSYKDDGTDINLALCMSWYQDVLGVKRMYESCNMYDPHSPQHFIAINGVYPFFKYKDKPTPELSDDGSREFLEKQRKVTIIDHSGHEVEKRTAYLKKAEELGCDAIIIIDSDEYLHPEYRDWKVFREWLVKYVRTYDYGCNGMIFNIMSWIDKDYVRAYNTTEVDEFTLVPRVWHSPKNLEYYNGVHYWVRRKNSDAVGEKLLSTAVTIEHGIRLAQDSKLRDMSSLEARDNSNKYNIKHEDTLIKKYNLAYNLPYSSIYKRLFGNENISVITQMSPLLAVTMNHYYPEVIENIKKIVNVDKIYLDGFGYREEALNRARSFFLENEEYSHLILTSDFINFQRSDINRLIARMVNRADIVTGYSVWHENGKCTFSQYEVHFMLGEREWHRNDPINHVELDVFGFIEAKYTDLIFTGIPRRILENNDFDSKIDIGFCWDVTHKGYSILVDPEIQIPMMKPHDRQVSDNPTLLFEKRQVDIDTFMF